MEAKAKEYTQIIMEEAARLKATGRYTFDEQVHIYRMDGMPVPSVTKFISKPPSEDLLYNQNFIRATQRGTDTHAYMEDVLCQITGQPRPEETPVVYEEIKGYCRAVDQFVSDSGYIPIYSELRVHSHAHHFAGTMDILALHPKDGKLAIVDGKTVAKLQPYTGLQLAGYAFCFHEMFGKLIKEKVKHREALWLQSNGNYTIVPYKNKSDESVMLCKLVSHQWDQANGIK